MKGFNKQKRLGAIGYAGYTWNPVTGCKHGCEYCWAKSFGMTDEPGLHPERLEGGCPKAPMYGPGKNVLTVDMGDLFGEWVPVDWVTQVLAAIERCPMLNFLLLTKNPKRLPLFDYPSNAWVGTSVDKQYRVEPAQEALSQVKATVRWFSCEPLLEPLVFSDLSMVNWLVLGGLKATPGTDYKSFQPPKEWVDSLSQQARDAGVKLWYKTNLGTRGPQELPDTGWTLNVPFEK